MLTYFSFHFHELLGLRDYNKVISMMSCHRSSCLFLSEALLLSIILCIMDRFFIKGGFFLGPSCCLKPKVLSYVHDNPMGGHFK